MKQAIPKSIAGRQWPYAVVFFGLLLAFSGSESRDLGIGLIMLGAIGFGVRQMEIRRTEQAAERATREITETARAEAAAKAAREAEDRHQAEEEERRYQAEQAATLGTLDYQRLHTQVNELLDYARQMKPDSDNKMALQATMSVIGRIATQTDLEARFFDHEGIREDTRLFFEQMKRAGVQDDVVYQRAVRVLRYQPPEGTPLRAVG